MCTCQALKQFKIDRERSKCKQSTSTPKPYERGVIIEVQVRSHRKKESLILPGARLRLSSQRERGIRTEPGRMKREAVRPPWEAGQVVTRVK